MFTALAAAAQDTSVAWDDLNEEQQRVLGRFEENWDQLDARATGGDCRWARTVGSEDDARASATPHSIVSSSGSDLSPAEKKDQDSGHRYQRFRDMSPDENSNECVTIYVRLQADA